MNYPPGGAPPPMSPPPGGYPSPGQPAYYAPPPKKSGAMKWILIGCGTIGVLGVLCCGGISFLGYWGAKKLAEEATARVKPLIEANEHVQQEIGDVKDVSVRWKEFKTEKEKDQDVITCTLDVTGSRGKGEVFARMRGRQGSKTAFVTLTFRGQDGKTSPIGTWKITEDGQFTKVDGEPGASEVQPPPPRRPQQ